MQLVDSSLTETPIICGGKDSNRDRLDSCIVFGQTKTYIKMQPNCFYFDKFHRFLLKISAKPQFSWADLAKNSIFAKGKTSLQREKLPN